MDWLSPRDRGANTSGGDVWGLRAPGLPTANVEPLPCAERLEVTANLERFANVGRRGPLKLASWRGVADADSAKNRVPPSGDGDDGGDDDADVAGDAKPAGLPLPLAGLPDRKPPGVSTYADGDSAAISSVVDAAACCCCCFF